MAMTIGLRQSSMRISSGLKPSPRDLSPDVTLPNSLMSAPATKVLPPPMITAAPMESSRSIRSSAAAMPSGTPGLSAFTGGLLIVTTAISPCCVNCTRSFIADLILAAFRRDEVITHVSDLFAIGRPRRHVDRSLSAEQLHQCSDFVVAHRHQTQRNILVLRMPFHIFIVSEKNHPFPIRRRMRKPIVRIIRSHSLLSAPVWMHAPDLHRAGTLRIKINVPTIRRIIRPVVQTLRSRQANFFAGVGWNSVNVEIAVSFADKREHFSIRRPTVPI